jgi:hypothetical protein
VKYSEQRQVVEDLRALADFYEQPRSIALPRPTLYFGGYVGVGAKWNSEAKEYEYDVEGTQAEMAKMARALGTCEKDYNDYELKLTKKFGSAKIVVSANRNAVCERKLVGVETVEARFVKAHTKPIYEYDCKPSLLAD